MKRSFFDSKTIVLYALFITLALIAPLFGNRIVTTFSENQQEHHYVVLDAGHGGVDGGAVSCTGISESAINLEIALKMNDLMHLLGIRTVMIRDTDRSVYTNGQTIAAKKVSDIKERVRIVNSTPNALFVSIHQNNFHNSKYSGAQVFYNSQKNSKELAESVQAALCKELCPKNNRQIKQSSGIYLMEHINCAGILIECGFLSNPAEEAKLRSDVYQKNLCCVIATTIHRYLNT